MSDFDPGHNTDCQTCQRRASTQSLWQGHDSQENWDRNCADPRKRLMLESSGWLDSNLHIEYSYNRHGFRDSEFVKIESGLALGCSFTEGVGVALDQCWPRQLSHMVGLPVWNLGIGGSGISTAFRVLDRWLPQLKPRFVALLIPPAARLEICTDRGHDTIMPTNIDNVGWHQDSYVKHWMAEPQNALTEQRKSLLAMRSLCEQQAVPFVSWDYSILHDFDDYHQHRARDLAHFSPVAYQRFAELAAEKIKSKLQ